MILGGFCVLCVFAVLLGFDVVLGTFRRNLGVLGFAF